MTDVSIQHKVYKKTEKFESRKNGLFYFTPRLTYDVIYSCNTILVYVLTYFISTL